MSHQIIRQDEDDVRPVRSCRRRDECAQDEQDLWHLTPGRHVTQFFDGSKKKMYICKRNVSAANIRLMNNDFKQGVVSGGYNESGVRALMIVSKFTKNNKSSIWQHCCQLVASSVVVTTTYGATSDGKVVKLTTFYFQYYVILSNWNMICYVLVIPMPLLICK